MLPKYTSIAYLFLTILEDMISESKDQATDSSLGLVQFKNLIIYINPIYKEMNQHLFQPSLSVPPEYGNTS